MATDYIGRHREGVHEDTVKKVAVALARVAFGKTSPPPTLEREIAFISRIFQDATSVARSIALLITSNVDYNHDGDDGTLDIIIDVNWAILAYAFEGV